MPMCGFNEKMINGLRDFYLGLVEFGVYKRGKEKGQAPEQRLQGEVNDMNRFLREAESLADPEVREVTRTLSEHARAFYRLVQKRGIINYASTIGSLIQFDVEMDRKYYQELEGKPQDMAQLVNHLNTVGVN